MSQRHNNKQVNYPIQRSILIKVIMKTVGQLSWSRIIFSTSPSRNSHNHSSGHNAVRADNPQWWILLFIVATISEDKVEQNVI